MALHFHLTLVHQPVSIRMGKEGMRRWTQGVKLQLYWFEYYISVYDRVSLHISVCITGYPPTGDGNNLKIKDIPLKQVEHLLSLRPFQSILKSLYTFFFSSFVFVELAPSVASESLSLELILAFFGGGVYKE